MNCVTVLVRADGDWGNLSRCHVLWLSKTERIWTGTAGWKWNTNSVFQFYWFGGGGGGGNCFPVSGEWGKTFHFPVFSRKATFSWKTVFDWPSRLIHSILRGENHIGKEITGSLHRPAFWHLQSAYTSSSTIPYICMKISIHRSRYDTDSSMGELESTNVTRH